jgi:dCTP deaminase
MTHELPSSNGRTQFGELFPELERERRTLSSSHTTGILPSQDIEGLIAARRIFSDQEIPASHVQPASLDLRLGNVAYRVRASFLPGERSTVRSKIEKYRMHEIDLTQPAALERGCVYVVPLMEELKLPSDIWGMANPKSSTGRLDIFTRLIVDHSGEFERVPEGYKGGLYLEVVPRTFSILVQQGLTLGQLRLSRGKPPPRDSILDELDRNEKLVFLEGAAPAEAQIGRGLWVSIDLAGNEKEIVGFRAKRHTPLLDLRKIDFYDPLEFWEPVRRPADGVLILDPDEFYILASRERIRIPRDYSATMVAYDPSVGEFRIHYAGFFDPGFGYGDDGVVGARAVLEVRSHEVPFVLEHGQVVGSLAYERLLQTPNKIYGKGIGSSYQSQGLALSKQFRRI